MQVPAVPREGSAVGGVSCRVSPGNVVQYERRCQEALWSKGGILSEFLLDSLRRSSSLLG